MLEKTGFLFLNFPLSKDFSNILANTIRLVSKQNNPCTIALNKSFFLKTNTLLAREKFAGSLSGKGAAISGARWNSVGIEMIYTAANRSLAMAEVANPGICVGGHALWRAVGGAIVTDDDLEVLIGLGKHAI